MNKFFKLVSVILVSVLLSSCATIFSGSSKLISFNSKEEGIEVYKDGLFLCEAPCVRPIKKSLSDVRLSVEKEGNKTRVVSLDQEMDPWFVASLLFSLGFGALIDLATGAVYDFSIDSYDIEILGEKSNSRININPSFRRAFNSSKTYAKKKERYVEKCDCTQLNSGRKFDYVLKKGETCKSKRGTEDNPLYCKSKNKKN